MEVSIAEATAVLSRTPGALRELLEGLPETWLMEGEGAGTFSPRDVVGHLIHGEKTDWVPRIKLILSGGEVKTFVPFERFGFRDAIQSISTSALLAEFAALRTSNLAYVRELPLEAPPAFAHRPAP